MKGPAPTMRNSGEVTEPEVKVKRKCGRPRNPIPRHRRVSHINAEQRRRSKIQDGLQRLKNLVPKDIPSTRDSKADILTKAVEQTKYLQALHQERTEQLKELREEQQQLTADIRRYQENLPEGKLFDEKPRTAHQRFEDHVAQQTSENYKYFIFSYIMRPLHQKFEEMVDCRTLETFNDSTWAWANATLSQKGLRPVITDALKTLSMETSFIDKPHQMAEEAMQKCQQNAKAAIPATITSPSSSSSTDPCFSMQPRQSPHKHHTTTTTRKHQKPRSTKQTKKSSSNSRSCSRSCSSSCSTSGRQSTDSVSSLLPHADLFQPTPVEPPATAATAAAAAAVAVSHQQPAEDLMNMFLGAALSPVVKSESVVSCSAPFSGSGTMTSPEGSPPLPKMEVDQWASYIPAADLPSQDADSPLSIDSAIELSPPRSAYDSSVFGDMTGYESSLDQGFDQDVITSAASYVSSDNFLQQHAHPVHSVLGDLENFDISDFVPPYQMSSPPFEHHAPGSDSLDQNLLEHLNMPIFNDSALDLMDTEGSQSLLDLIGNCHQDDQYSDSHFVSL